MISSAAELFKAVGLKTRRLEIAGAEVTIRELSVGGRMRLADTDGTRKSAIVLVRECLVAPDGTPLFGPDDDEKIMALPPDFVDGVAAAVANFSRPEEKKD